MSFLKGLMEGVPDLGDDEEAAPAEPKAKKRRFEVSASIGVLRHHAGCQLVGMPACAAVANAAPQMVNSVHRSACFSGG